MTRYLLALALALSFGTAAQAADAHHDHHGHAGKGPAVARLELNDGKKWQTDAPLRAAMTAIRNEFNAAIKPIHAKTFTAAQYAKLATDIEKQVASIVANCRLPPDADAQLHLVVADLAAAATMMKGDDDRFLGAVRLVRALGAYPKYFAHEGWKPLDH